MLLAGSAMFFAPHAGKIISKQRSSSAPTHASQLAMLPLVTPLGVISTQTEFRLPPDMAFDDLIREAAIRYSVKADLIKAVVRAESAFDPRAVSRSNALGLAQLLPGTAREVAYELKETLPSDSLLFEPDRGLRYGAHYLKKLLKRFDGAVPKVRPSPLLGQHVEDVLGAWLGMSASEITVLRQQGIL